MRVFSPIKNDGELENVSWCYHISFNNREPQEYEDVKDTPPELEEGIKATIDALKEINLGTDEDKKNPLIARPIKQAQRRFRPELVPVIKTEVNKPIKVVFINKVKYPTWVSSIVPVRKKNGQIRVCVDFRDLNNACPKDEFPLPIPELMIDVTTRYEAMSFWMFIRL
ncbi:uncharacterized protein [Solanum tuberosum]|uniref:uncharacterized protein n=1 Tax=Solanum tuberosum TaxID=4113 RepID=UPI00073A2FE5|nr:PREDICTED: uncharacterized protein LOC107058454 [Solanum tuberosum]